jgi:hypothetical protein
MSMHLSNLLVLIAAFIVVLGDVPDEVPMTVQDRAYTSPI